MRSGRHVVQHQGKRPGGRQERDGRALCGRQPGCCSQLGTRREGAQRARGDLRGRNHNRNNVGIKQGHLRHLQIGEAIPTGLRYGQIPQPLPRSPPPWGAPLSSCAVMRAGWGKTRVSQGRACGCRAVMLLWSWRRGGMATRLEGCHGGLQVL